VFTLVAGLLAPGAYTVVTMSSPHTGSIPVSGPTTSGFGGGFGGGGGNTSSALVGALRASTTRWAAATIGSQSAAPLELASGASVMAIGGFTGSDDSPTLAQFEAYVRAGDIHYFVAGGGGGPGGGAGAAASITEWVTAHYSATTIGGQTVYDLTN
jgi:hypothetical protein